MARLIHVVYHSWHVPAVCLLACGFLTGCSGNDGPVKAPPLAKVQGIITLGGEPLAAALVEFSPLATGKMSSGTTDDSGMYTLTYDAGRQGAAVGDHTVRIITRLGAAAIDGEEKVPAKYNVNSELKATVEDGENSIDFDLDL